MRASNTKISESTLDQYWKDYEGKLNFTSTFSHITNWRLEYEEANTEEPVEELEI